MSQVIQIIFQAFLNARIAAPSVYLRQPVIPAFSQWRLLYRVMSLRNFYTNCGRSGRGPTTLMSPLRTLTRFQACVCKCLANIGFSR